MALGFQIMWCRQGGFIFAVKKTNISKNLLMNMKRIRVTTMELSYYSRKINS